MPDYRDCILFLLSKANQRVYREFKRRLHPTGLTPVHLLVLCALLEEEGCSAGELGKRLMLDGATLSGVLERMEEAGWVVKAPAQADRRMLRLNLTPKAREAVPEIMRLMERANEESLAPFRLEERLLLKRMLRDLQSLDLEDGI